MWLMTLLALNIPPAGVDLVHIVSQPMRATALIGMPVRSRSGEPAGKIEDLALDTGAKRVRYALVGGAQGRYAVSLFDLRLSLDHAYFSLREQRSGTLAAAEAAQWRPVTQMLGQTLRARNAAPLGKLAEVLVDVHEGAVPFVLVERDARLHPLPLDALRPQANGVMRTLDPEVLRIGPRFSAAALQANLGNNAFLTQQATYADYLTRDAPAGSASLRSSTP